MAGELQTSNTSGQVLYAVLWGNNGQVYNTVTPGMEAYNASNWASYAVALAEKGASGHYVGDMPAVAAGVYDPEVRLRVGVAAALTDPSLGVGALTWNGTGEVSLGALLGSDGRALVSANTHTSGETVAAITAGVTVSTNSDKTGYALTGAEHTTIGSTDVPAGLTAQGYTSARAPKLDNLDVATSTRLATSGYTAPPTSAANAAATAAAVLAVPANLLQTDSSGRVTAASVAGAVGSVTGNVGGNVVGSVASVTGAVGSVTAGVTVATNNDKTGYALSSAEHTAIGSTDVPAGLLVNGYTSARAVKLDNLDATVSSRNATAPDNTSIGTILTRVDVATSTRLASAGYTAPDNADIALIKAQTDQMQFDGSGFIKADAVAASNVTVAGYAAGQDPATLLLLTPVNKLATDSSGRVLASSVVGNVGGSVASVTGAVGSVTAGVSVAGTVALSGADEARLLHLDADVSSRLPTSGYTAPPADYQQRGVAVTLPTSPPSGYGGGGVVVDGSGRVTLTPAEHTNVASDTASALNAQGYTTTRAAKLDDLDATVSSRLPASADPTSVLGGLHTDVGTVLTNQGTINTNVLTRLPTSGYTAPDNTNIVAIKAQTDQLAFTGGAVQASAVVTDKTGFKLASDGLDSISVADIIDDTDARATFPKMVRTLFNRLFNRGTVTATTETVANDAGTTVLTMALSDDGTTATKGRSS